MPVEQGEMGGGHHLPRPDRPAAGHGLPVPQGQDLRVLMDAQAPGNGGDEPQGVELGLARETHRPGGGDGQRQVRYQPGGDPQLFQHGHLVFQLVPAATAVHIGVLFLEIAVDLPAERPVPRQRSLVGLQVQAGGLQAKFPGQPAVDQPVLGRNLRGGVPRNAAADPVRLQQQIVHPRLLQKIGAQNPGHPAADDQHVRLHTARQGVKLRQTRRLFPNRAHTITSSQAVCTLSGKLSLRRTARQRVY